MAQPVRARAGADGIELVLRELTTLSGRVVDAVGEPLHGLVVVARLTESGERRGGSYEAMEAGSTTTRKAVSSETSEALLQLGR